MESGRTKRQIKGNLTIKKRGDQKYLIFGLQKRAHTGWKRRREKGRREKKKKKKRPRKVWILVWNSMELWFCMEFVWLYDFEYGIMFILDFGRDFYGFQT